MAAADAVKPSIAALAAAYAWVPKKRGEGEKAVTEPMLRILPPPDRRMSGTACLQHRKTLRRFTFRTQSQPSSVQRSTGPSPIRRPLAVTSSFLLR